MLCPAIDQEAGIWGVLQFPAEVSGQRAKVAPKHIRP